MLLKPSVHLKHPPFDTDSNSQKIQQPRPVKTTAREPAVNQFDDHLAQSDDYVLTENTAPAVDTWNEIPFESNVITEVLSDAKPKELMQDYNEDLASWLAAFCPIPDNFVKKENWETYKKYNEESRVNTKFWKRKRNLPPNWIPRNIIEKEHIKFQYIHRCNVKHTAFIGDWVSQRPLLSRAEIAYHLKKHYEAGHRLKTLESIDIKSTARYARWCADKHWKAAEVAVVKDHETMVAANDEPLNLDSIGEQERLSMWFAQQEMGKEVDRPFEELRKACQLPQTKLYNWLKNKEVVNPSESDYRSYRAPLTKDQKFTPKQMRWDIYWQQKYQGQYGLNKWLKAREPINKGLYACRYIKAKHILTIERAKAAYSLAVRHYLNGKRSEEQLKATYKYLFKHFPEFYPQRWPVLVGPVKTVMRNSFNSERLALQNQAFLSGKKKVFLLEHKPVVTPWKFTPNPVKEPPKPAAEVEVITKAESEFSRSTRQKLFYYEELEQLIRHEIEKARNQIMMEWTLSGPEVIDQIAGQVTKAVKENLDCPRGYIRAANGLYLPERISA